MDYPELQTELTVIYTSNTIYSKKWNHEKCLITHRQAKERDKEKKKQQKKNIETDDRLKL